MDSLFKLWDDVLKHNNTVDKNIYNYFIKQVRDSIPHDAVSLEGHFIRLSKDYRGGVSEIFRDHALFLLNSPTRKWTNENIIAIKKLLHNKSLNWYRENIIQSLDFISQSRSLE